MRERLQSTHGIMREGVKEVEEEQIMSGEKGEATNVPGRNVMEVSAGVGKGKVKVNIEREDTVKESP